jgi:hypothetical protein
MRLATKSRKLASPESSAALSVNTFGWFIERPEVLPPFSEIDADYPATLLDAPIGRMTEAH